MIARWLLHRLGEEFGIVSTFAPKPMKGDWWVGGGGGGGMCSLGGVAGSVLFGVQREGRVPVLSPRAGAA